MPHTSSSRVAKGLAFLSVIRIIRLTESFGSPKYSLFRTDRTVAEEASDMTAPATTTPDTGVLNPRRWLIAVVMMVAALMDLLDGTVTNVALPTIQRDLGASGDQLAWVVSAYLLAFAASLITAGQLGDRYGRRRLFLLGTAAFGVASLASALAQTPGQLIGFRIVQGAAAAVVAPQVLATFRAIFPREERGKAFALYGAVGGLAASLGLIAGGALTSADLFGTGWRMIFLVNVPLTVAVLVLSLALVPETRVATPLHPDLLGTVLLAAGIVAVVYPLLEGQSHGWPVWCWLMLAAGSLALVSLFLVDSRHQERGAATLLPTPLLKVPAFGAGVAVQLAFSAAMNGSVLVLALWVQTGQHWSPIRAGLVMTSFGVGTILTAPMSESLAPRFGRNVLAFGAVLMAVGTAGLWLASLHAQHGVSAWQVMPGLFVAGLGLGLLVVPLINVVLVAVPAHQAGSAAGLFSTAQQLGGAIGVAILSSAFFGRLPGHGFTSAFAYATPRAVVAYALCAVLCLLLPKTAVAEDPSLAEADDAVLVSR
jgi:EmrB/QacA subfamily drug resistance transporter